MASTSLQLGLPGLVRFHPRHAPAVLQNAKREPDLAEAKSAVWRYCLNAVLARPLASMDLAPYRFCWTVRHGKKFCQVFRATSIACTCHCLADRCHGIEASCRSCAALRSVLARQHPHHLPVRQIPHVDRHRRKPQGTSRLDTMMPKG